MHKKGPCSSPTKRFSKWAMDRSVDLHVDGYLPFQYCRVIFPTKLGCCASSIPSKGI